MTLHKIFIVNSWGRGEKQLFDFRSEQGALQDIDVNDINTLSPIKKIFARFACVFIVQNICILPGIYFIV